VACDALHAGHRSKSDKRQNQDVLDHALTFLVVVKTGEETENRICHGYSP
jgi:hypothetical protein